jgi:signal transduction histidine kinase
VDRLVSLARRHGFDAAIVLVAVGTALDIALRHGDAKAPTTPAWFAAPAAALVVLVLLLRRRWPFGAPAAVWLLATVLALVDGRLITFTAGATAAGLAASFLLGQVRDELRARIGLGISLAGAAVVVLRDPTTTPGDVLFILVPFAVAWLAGYALRQARREQETAARLAVAEERARIARELHDVVAHALSVIVLQAGAVRHHLPAEQADDAEALRGVEDTGRTALAEMRHLLGAMRGDGEEVAYAPQPGLARLDALADEVRRAGLEVAVRTEGEPRPLPRTLDLSAYRVAQEGLTNALKHARASRADVTVGYAPGRVRIAVRDDGRGASPTDGQGHGLVGVRERVKLYGGEMTAGAVAGGGFELVATFPTNGATP